MKEKRWLGTQKKYEIHCFYCGGFHITGNCPQVVKAMNGWKYDRSCPETGHIKIVPNGDEYPTVLAFNGYHYRVVGLWGIPGRLLWLELERFYGDTIVAATFCPDELMEMDLGMSDDEQLSAWLGGLPFLSVSPPEFNGSEKGENLSGDVIVPVEEIRPGRYRMSVEVEIGHCGYVGRDTDQACAGCSQLRIIDPEVVCPFEWLDGAVFRAIEEG
jgi:hypothetical protein